LADRVLIERKAVLNIIDQMRIAIPQEIQRAAELEAEREGLLALANAEAEEIVAAAHERAEQLVQDHTVLQAAQERAAAIIVQAEQQAADTIDQAETYASGELRGLERQLARLQRVVANGLGHLQERHEARQRDAAPKP
jgi:vacuolar-type H+-ATPase subunit H